MMKEGNLSKMMRSPPPPPYLFTKADPLIDLLVEFKNLVDYVHKHYNVPNIDYVSLWWMIFQLESLGDASYSNILRLAELCFTFAVANAKPETGFSHMKRMETNYRSRLSERNLSTIVRIGMDGEEYLKYDSVKAVDTFLKSKYRGLGSTN